MTEIVLVETPPSVPVKFLPTDVAQKIWIVFYIFVPENLNIKNIFKLMWTLPIPYMNTIIGLMSPAASGVFKSLLTFTAFEELQV